MLGGSHKLFFYHVEDHSSVLREFTALLTGEKHLFFLPKQPEMTKPYFYDPPSTSRDQGALSKSCPERAEGDSDICEGVFLCAHKTWKRTTACTHTHTQSKNEAIAR